MPTVTNPLGIGQRSMPLASNAQNLYKADGLPYLKSGLDSLHESPSYIRTMMYDVKKTSAMLIGRLEEVKQELEAEKGQAKENNAEVEDKKEVKVADKALRLHRHTKNRRNAYAAVFHR